MKLINLFTFILLLFPVALATGNHEIFSLPDIKLLNENLVIKKIKINLQYKEHKDGTISTVVLDYKNDSSKSVSVKSYLAFYNDEKQLLFTSSHETLQGYLLKPEKKYSSSQTIHLTKDEFKKISIIKIVSYIK